MLIKNNFNDYILFISVDLSNAIDKSDVTEYLYQWWTIKKALFSINITDEGIITLSNASQE